MLHRGRGWLLMISLIICSLQENLALHWQAVKSETFFKRTGVPVVYQAHMWRLYKMYKILDNRHEQIWFFFIFLSPRSFSSDSFLDGSTVTWFHSSMLCYLVGLGTSARSTVVELGYWWGNEYYGWKSKKVVLAKWNMIWSYIPVMITMAWHRLCYLTIFLAWEDFWYIIIADDRFHWQRPGGSSVRKFPC